MTEHPFRTEEQRIAQARLLRDLHQMLTFARDANYVNHAHTLGLDPIDEQPIIKAISIAVQTFRPREAAVVSPTTLTPEG